MLCVCRTRTPYLYALLYCGYSQGKCISRLFFRFHSPSYNSVNQLHIHPERTLLIAIDQDNTTPHPCWFHNRCQSILPIDNLFFLHSNIVKSCTFNLHSRNSYSINIAGYMLCHIMVIAEENANTIYSF